MSVLSKDEFFNSINEIIGTNTDDKSIAFIENMTDTYNAMSQPSEMEDWKQKYNELDESWRKKYQNRFFSSVGECNSPHEKDKVTEEIEQAENISVDDLFE